MAATTQRQSLPFPPTNDVTAMAETTLNVDLAARQRTINVGAGPSQLPTNVLLESAQATLEYQNSGMGVTEMSHRSAAFKGIIEKAEADLRTLLGLGDHWAVLFSQGGGTEQFAATVLNLLNRHAATYPHAWADGSSKVPCDYAVSGSWSSKAFNEAKRLRTQAHAVFDSRTLPDAEGKFGTVPPVKDWALSPTADVPPAFLYYCDNETVDGVEYRTPAPDGCAGFPVHELPDDYASKVPIVADMSSNILSRPIAHLDKHGIVFFGAQKNVGPPGVTIVLVKKNLLVNPDAKELVALGAPAIPTTLVYKTQADNGSLYNTPPMHAIYVSGLVFAHLLSQGGVKGAEERSQQKAKLLYGAIDASQGVFTPTVRQAGVRSLMNVTFRVCDPATAKPSPDLEKAFIQRCKDNGIVQIGGHRSVGGCRASLYNAVTVEQAEKVAQVMAAFADEIRA